MISHPLDRRSALRASAWALPAVALTTATPAFASSLDRGPLMEHVSNFGTTTNLRITNRSSQDLTATFSARHTPTDNRDVVGFRTIENIFTYLPTFSSSGGYYSYSGVMPPYATLNFSVGWRMNSSDPFTTTLILASTAWPDVLLPITMP